MSHWKTVCVCVCNWLKKYVLLKVCLRVGVCVTEYMHACLDACLSACLPACLPACLFVYLHTCLPNCLGGGLGLFEYFKYEKPQTFWANISMEMIYVRWLTLSFFFELLKSEENYYFSTFIGMKFDDRILEGFFNIFSCLLIIYLVWNIFFDNICINWKREN